MNCPPEEERVRAVLRDLRGKSPSEQVKADIDRLEKVLEDPLFRQISRKSLEKTRPVKKGNRDTDLFEYLCDAVGDDISVGLKDNQRVVFGDFDASQLRPSILETDRPSQKLLVVGPKDIKSRSRGQIRIGDRIQAIAVRDAPQPAQPSNTRENTEGGGAKLEGEAAAAVNVVPSTVGEAVPERGGASRGRPLLARAPDRETFECFCEKGGYVAVASVRESTNMVLSGDWTQVEVIRLSTESGGLGFGIVGGTSTGVVVKTILPGSPADKDQHLKPGDHILQIGNVNTHGMSSQQVATILRQQDTLVEMIVGRPINYVDRPADTPECWTMATRAALNAGSLEAEVRAQAAQKGPTPDTSPMVSASESLQEQPEENATEVPDHSGASKKEDEGVESRAPADEFVNDGEVPSTSSKASEAEKDIRRTSNTSRTSKLSGAKGLSLDLSVPIVSNGRTSRASDPTPPTPTTSRISLRTLQEMALTVFLRENWEDGPYETIYVELNRDPALGLGITVAGYVHRKEEIGGVFVKSLVPRSAAAYSQKIRVHDLILEVNGVSLECLSHADSVRTLVKSGQTVLLKLIRFAADSAQAQCLKMLQEQETDTQVIDVHSSNPDLVAEWKRRLSDEVDIISAVVRPDKKEGGDGGLGISLEGTVDVVNGHQLCPHHYIESIRHDGPAAKTNLFQSGDELLQVNHSPLFGESHVTVRQALTRAVNSGAPVTLIVARRAQHVSVYQPKNERSLPLSYSLLASGQDRIVKAKSEMNLQSPSSDPQVRPAPRRLRSRSLEPFAGLAVWNCVPLIMQLEKDTRGLGFSIVDYQDPSHPGETVIVIQSLVPGGIAQADGRIVPGDRLLFVNNHDLSNSSLERAVAALKAAPMGRVRLGIAKPVPVDQCNTSSHSPLCSRSERLLARGSSPRGRRRRVSGVTSSQETVWIGADNYRKLHPQGYYPSRSPSSSRSIRSLEGSDISMTSWSPCSTRSISPAGSPLPLRGSWAYDVIYLPTHLERSVKIQKGPLPLGIVLDADRDKSVNGCIVKSICGKKAVALDGRLQVGDYIVKINTESLRNVTTSQARAILKRTNLIGTQCNVTYITGSDAKVWKERFHRDSEPQSPSISRLSPKVFPKFYRSPYLSRKTSRDLEDTEPFSEASDAGISEMKTIETVVEPSQVPPPEHDRLHAPAGRIVDGMEIDNFVYDIIQEALREAILELAVSQRFPDWRSRSHSTRRPLPPETSPPHPRTPQTSKQNSVERQGSPPYSAVRKPSTPAVVDKTPETIEEPESTTPDLPSPPSDSLLRRDSEPVLKQKYQANETVPTPAQSQTPDTSEDEPRTSEEESQPSAVPDTDTPSSMEVATEPEVPEPSTSHRSELSINVTREEMRVTCRTPSTGSDNLQIQAKQLARSKFWGEARTVMLHKEPNKSFGISIVGGRVEVSQKGGLPGTGNTVSGIFIKSVLPNSPAGKSGMMNMGDRVISVNDVDLKEATHEQAVTAIKNATNPVKFVLQSLHSFTPQQQMINSSSNSTLGSIRVEQQGADKPDPENDVKKETEREEIAPAPAKKVEVVTEITSATLIRRESVQSQEGTEKIEERRDSLRKVEVVEQRRHSVQKQESLEKNDHRRESVQKQESIEEKTDRRASLQKEESAEKEERRESVRKQESTEKVVRKESVDRQMSAEKEGSRKTSVKSSSSEKQRKESTGSQKGSITSKKSKKDSVKKKHAQDGQRKTSYASGPLIVSDVSSSETHEDILCEQAENNSEKSRIDAESAAFPSRAADDTERESKYFYTKRKMLAKYGDLGGELVLVECDTVPEAGLGISLAGNRDRDKLNVFVVAVKIACPLAIRKGDELLEVNGRVLRGLSHMVASNIIRECCSGGLEFVVCRREGAINDCAVRDDPLINAIPEPEPTPSMAPTVDVAEPTLNTIEAVRKKSCHLERSATIENGKETLIEIDKEGKGLGLSIVGGSDTVLGTVVIHEVYPDGAAAHDGRLQPGDQVLEVNNISLRGVTHDQAISSLRRTPPKVRLLIFRDVNLQDSLMDPTQIYNMFEVELQKKPGRGLGLSIVGRKNEPGVYVSEVVKGGTAEADGRLMTGDQILSVNGQDVANSMQEDVAAMLKTCNGKVNLKIGRWKLAEATTRVHAAAEAASLKTSVTTPRQNGPEEEVPERPVPSPAPPMPPTIIHTAPEGDEVAADLSPVLEETSSGTEQVQYTVHRSVNEDDRSSLAYNILHDLKEEGCNTMMVELRKIPEQQLGMGIGKRSRGILVTSLQPGSNAAEKLRVGDRILAVNALPVSDQLSAVTFVKASGERLFLQIARPNGES